MTSSYVNSQNDYSKRSIKEAIREDPDMFAGNPIEVPFLTQVYDLDKKEVVTRNVKIADANVKCFKEALSNATDHAFTTTMHCNWNPDKSVKDPSKWKHPDIGTIKIDISEDVISVYNEGEAMPLAPIPTLSNDKKYILPPFLAFGVEYSGTNNDKSKLGLGCGKNGIGAKIINVLSKEFQIEVGNSIMKQHYIGRWKDNMQEVVEDKCSPGYNWDGSSWVPNVGKVYNEKSFVKVSYSPDFERYRWSRYNYTTICYFAQLAHDASFTSRVPIEFTWTLESMKKSKTFKFNFAKPDDYLKSLKINIAKCPKMEQFVWHENAMRGQCGLIHKNESPKFLPIAKQKEIAYNPMCMEDYPLAEIYMFDTPGKGALLSFVNGNEAKNGGIHVKATVNPIIEDIKNLLGIKFPKRGESIFFENVTILILCRVPQATYKGQTKDELCSYSEFRFCKDGSPMMDKTSGKQKTTKITKLSVNYINGFQWFYGWAAYKAIVDAGANEEIKAKVIKNSKHIQVDKLDNANLAGTDRGYLCTLNLCEGDAAKDYPSNMIHNFSGQRDLHGIMPLRGKILNVVKCNDEKYMNSSALKSIIDAVGLQEGVDYSKPENYKTLRYGFICLFADADVDGDHIKCLFINFLYAKYRTFIETGRLSYYQTPIIRIIKQTVQKSLVKDVAPTIINRFYTESDFEVWSDENITGTGESRRVKGISSKISIKYLKGLASSNAHDVEDDYEYGKKIVISSTTCEETAQNMHLAFGKRESHTRKKWIEYFSTKVKIYPEIYDFKGSRLTPAPRSFLLTKRAKKSHSDSIIVGPQQEDQHFRQIVNILNTDLIKFSLATFERALPSIRDGLKKAQRQAISVIINEFNYGKNISKTEKVSRLGAKVSDQTHYRHGETSMFMTIMKMCQEFTGGNNLAFLYPDGGFGTRREGGKDLNHSKSRYAYTSSQAWHQLLMDKKFTSTVPRNLEEGNMVEPQFIPMYIIMCVVNGSIGISTAYKTYILPHNIFDVINFYMDLVDGKDVTMPMPWFKGFKGKNRVHGASLEISNEFSICQQTYSDVASSHENMEEDDDGEDLDIEEKVDKVISDDLGYDYLNRFIDRNKDQHMTSEGVFKVVSHNDNGTKNVHITELPIGEYTTSYITKVKVWISKGFIEDFRDGGSKIDSKLSKSNSKVSIAKQIACEEVDIMLYCVNQENITLSISGLELKRTHSMANMTLLDSRSNPLHFNNVGEIMFAHYSVVLKQFGKLHHLIISELENEIINMKYKQTLVRLVSERKLTSNMNSESWSEMMIKNGIPKEHHDKLLSQGGLKVLQKDDITKYTIKIQDLEMRLSEEMKMTPNQRYKEKLITLKNSFDGEYPKNTNPALVVSTS